MLKFMKSVPYIPDPSRSRPHITDRQKALASETPPHVVPFHCKPWVDGQTVGWTLFYGYLTDITVSCDEQGTIEVGNLEQLAKETNQPDIVSQFAEGHFGIGSGYTLQTASGWVSLILPATHAPTGLEALTAVIETDWYPRQIFLVFKMPAVGQTITLTHKTPLARVVVIPRHEALELQPLSTDETASLTAKRTQYLAEEKETDTRWTSASGQSFTHLYKQWSKQQRHQ